MTPTATSVPTVKDNNADQTYRYSTLKIPLREQSSQFWQCQLTRGDITCTSTQVSDTDLDWRRTPTPPVATFGMRSLWSKHTDVELKRLGKRVTFTATPLWLLIKGFAGFLNLTMTTASQFKWKKKKQECLHLSEFTGSYILCDPALYFGVVSQTILIPSD